MATAKIKISADTTEFQQGMNRVESGMKNLRGQTSSLGSSITSAVGGLTGLASAAGLFAAYKGIQLTAEGLTNIGKTAVSSAMSIETLTATFETLLKSKAKADEYIARIRKLAAETPMETTDIASAAAVLLQYTQNAELSFEVTKRLGDVTGGNTEKMKSAALVMGQVLSMGRLQAQDANQFIQSVGWNPLTQIGKDIGVSDMGKVKQMMEDGQISAKMLTTALINATKVGGDFYGNMERQSQTLAGKLSTLRDNWSALNAVMGEPIVDGLKAMTDATSESLPILEGNFRRIGEEIRDILIPLSEHIPDMIKGLNEFLGGDVGLGDVLAENLAKVFRDDRIKTSLMELVNFLINNVGSSIVGHWTKQPTEAIGAGVGAAFTGTMVGGALGATKGRGLAGFARGSMIGGLGTLGSALSVISAYGYWSDKLQGKETNTFQDIFGYGASFMGARGLYKTGKSVADYYSDKASKAKMAEAADDARRIGKAEGLGMAAKRGVTVPSAVESVMANNPKAQEAMRKISEQMGKNGFKAGSLFTAPEVLIADMIPLLLVELTTTAGDLMLEFEDAVNKHSDDLFNSVKQANAINDKAYAQKKALERIKNGKASMEDLLDYGGDNWFLDTARMNKPETVGDEIRVMTTTGKSGQEIYNAQKASLLKRLDDEKKAKQAFEDSWKNYVGDLVWKGKVTNPALLATDPKLIGAVGEGMAKKLSDYAIEIASTMKDSDEFDAWLTANPVDEVEKKKTKQTSPIFQPFLTSLAKIGGAQFFTNAGGTVVDQQRITNSILTRIEQAINKNGGAVAITPVWV